MNNAIITGHTGAIGRMIHRALSSSGYAVEGWSRSTGVDVLTSQLPAVSKCDLVVNVAETGPEGLERVWEHTRPALQASEGAFVFISSISVVQDQNPYATSKRRQEDLLYIMATAASNVRVNCLRLGHVIGTRHWPEGSPIKDQSLGRYVTLEDVASTVLFLAVIPSITGQILTLDAGSTLRL